jgi:hypothetical protein
MRSSPAGTGLANTVRDGGPRESKIADFSKKNEFKIVFKIA